ncbi:hypothetical protein CC80DRAFT_543871 [Byssothecium circinans]|uniref:Uncharacterized protein n=1 Tax=Byssothecium circinans TaxID=147558 RepID=A0A6A5U9X9_9PLEO|nr:hypothetical protein CC80DRAFT_543871 [Byssothecium circinans]
MANPVKYFPVLSLHTPPPSSTPPHTFSRLLHTAVYHLMTYAVVMIFVSTAALIALKVLCHVLSFLGRLDTGDMLLILCVTLFIMLLIETSRKERVALNRLVGATGVFDLVYLQ